MTSTSISTSTLRTAVRTTLLTAALAATVLAGGVAGAYNGQSTQGTHADSTPEAVLAADVPDRCFGCQG